MVRHTVALISDTHGWLDPALVGAFSQAEVILHAGDIGSPEVLTELARWAPVVAVRGNIDGGQLHDLPLTEVLTVGRKRIALIHIAGSPQRPNQDARLLLSRDNPDVIVVGHSHMPLVARLGHTLWLNPGAAGRHGAHPQRFAALLHIEGGKVSLDRIELGARGEGHRV